MLLQVLVKSLRRSACLWLVLHLRFSLAYLPTHEFSVKLLNLGATCVALYKCCVKFYKSNSVWKYFARRSLFLSSQVLSSDGGKMRNGYLLRASTCFEAARSTEREHAGGPLLGDVSITSIRRAGLCARCCLQISVPRTLMTETRRATVPQIIAFFWTQKLMRHVRGGELASISQLGWSRLNSKFKIINDFLISD